MMVMGIHVRHVWHRTRLVVPMVFVFFPVVVSSMFVLVDVVIASTRGSEQLGGH